MNDVITPQEILNEVETVTQRNGTTDIEQMFDISTAPSIPDVVYENLPETLKTRSKLFDDKHRRDIVLTATLPAVAAQMPNVLSEHRDKYYSPHLFTQIIADPGTGKGEATKGKLTARVTDSHIREESEREIQNWESLPDEEKARVTKPEKRSLFIPANASSRVMLDRLKANNGVGFIFENEIDTLVNATRQEWGDYVDTMRRAFHHETVSIIRKDDEYYIENPRLSVCLTGTFDQFREMFKSAENGHFSRYALYTYEAPRIWRSHRPTPQSRSLRESIDTAAENYFQMHRTLKARSEPVFVDLTSDQWDVIDNTCEEKMEIIEALDLSKYLHASNNRTGIIALRIISLFTVLRVFEEKPELLTSESSLTPTDADITAGIWLADTYIKHAIRLYYLLPEANNSDGKGERFKKFIAALPSSFETYESVEIGERMNIPESTVKRWLSTANEITRVQRGEYRKN